MTAKAETVTTLRYKAVTSKAGYRRLEDCMLLMGRFYNTVIQHREYATSSHRRQWSRKLQNIHLTDFHRHNPEYHEYARKLLEATIKRANLAYERFFKLAEQPGSNVRQKSGLNRGILAQNWGKIRAQLEYKCQWYGRTFVAVPAPFTSKACSQCGSIRKGNRRSQSSYRCEDCAYQANADVNAAINIRRQGLTGLARAENPPGRAAGSPDSG